MKEFIISIFSPLLQLNLIVSTIGGFILGGIIGGLGGNLFGVPSFNTTTAFIGAIIAFSNAAIVSGAGLALDRIRELLEEQNHQLRTQERRERDESVLKSESIVRPERVRPQSVTPPLSSVRKTRRCPDCGTETYAMEDYCSKCSARLT